LGGKKGSDRISTWGSQPEKKTYTHTVRTRGVNKKPKRNKTEKKNSGICSGSIRTIGMNVKEKRKERAVRIRGASPYVYIFFN
jgi:hypothetical protein